MPLASRDAGDTRIVTVNADRIDAALAIRFKDEMRGLTQEGPCRIVLNLTHVDFVDSSGLGAIVAAMKQLGPDRRLELAGLNAAVHKVFRLTRMDTVFALHHTLDEALDPERG
ncbi:MAG: STAS domain-containing protein [Rhodobacteraceae bacterium]|nr:STAS domain-containing protein [Paracoccaceae bacterium]